MSLERPTPESSSAESGNLKSRIEEQITRVSENVAGARDLAGRIAPNKRLFGRDFERVSSSEAKADNAARAHINIGTGFLDFLQRAQRALEQGNITLNGRPIEETLVEEEKKYDDFINSPIE